MTALKLDPSRAARAARALKYGAVTIREGETPGTYTVSSYSRDRNYTVRRTGSVWRCECPDARYRGTLRCKHALAVVLAAGLEDDRYDFEPEV